MGSPLEFEGKNVAAAVAAACKALNVAKERIDYTVLSHGSSGIFGLVGTKKAKIAVARPPVSVTDEVERIVNASLYGEETLRAPEKKGLNGGEGGAVNPESVNESEPREDPEEIGVKALKRIVDSITSDADIRTSNNHRRIIFHIEGGNQALLIGKRGQTLDAIQLLVEKIINKQNDKRVKIQVDVGGYLEKRETNLKELALRTAEKASRSGKPCTIGQMNAHDRRIVHLELKNDQRIRTQSIGKGSLKKLVIFPKKSANKNRRGG